MVIFQITPGTLWMDSLAISETHSRTEPVEHTLSSNTMFIHVYLFLDANISCLTHLLCWTGFFGGRRIIFLTIHSLSRIFLFVWKIFWLSNTLIYVHSLSLAQQIEIFSIRSQISLIYIAISFRVTFLCILCSYTERDWI